MPLDLTLSLQMALWSRPMCLHPPRANGYPLQGTLCGLISKKAAYLWFGTEWAGPGIWGASLYSHHCQSLWDLELIKSSLYFNLYPCKMENIILWRCSEHKQPNLMRTKCFGYFTCLKLKDLTWKPPITETRTLNTKKDGVSVYFGYGNLDLAVLSCGGLWWAEC